MPKSSPVIVEPMAQHLQAMGQHIRSRRKALGVSALVTAEAAGVSRVTLHRIEKGEPSVTVGAWSNVVAALGMQWQLKATEKSQVDDKPQAGWWPVRVPLADYPQLKKLAWQVQGVDHLTPVEAHDIYEAQARHLDVAAMSAAEKQLWQALQEAFGRKPADV